MLVVRSPRVPAARGAVGAFLLTVALAGPATAAASRLARPVTDAAAPAAPAPSLAPRGARAIAITPVENPMRELAPGVYEGITPYQLANGMWRVDLDERFQSYSVLRRAGGGGLASACVQGAAGLSKWRALGAACDPAPAAPAAAVAANGRRALVVTPTGSLPATWEVK